jgi:FtsP/CotA-like multicopper oxidase with cupredoxin domain
MSFLVMGEASSPGSLICNIAFSSMILPFTDSPTLGPTVSPTPRPTAVSTSPELGSGAPLNVMSSVFSVGGALTTSLTVDKFFFSQFDTLGSKFWTRVYNRASISGKTLHPGPVLRFKRGDTVTVTLVNNLGPETQALGGNSINSFHHVNTTNLHIHGLHVSAESPQDNVLMTVSPQDSFTYVYSIPNDHAGGTFWYHAHHHGATAVQVGGGLLGAIVVEDDPAEVPAAILNLPEHILLLSHIPADDLLRRYVSVTGDDLFNHVDNIVGPGAEFTLVNGQYQPVASIEQGRWLRMRIIFSSLTLSLQLQMTSNDIGCEWHLLAKDGIYVEGAPRSFGSVMYFGPGSRADVVVRCSSVGTAVFGTSTADPDQVIQSNIISLSVSVPADGGGPDGDLPIFTPFRPDYLADVLTATETTTFMADFQGTPGSCLINGNAWDGSTPVGTMVRLLHSSLLSHSICLYNVLNVRLPDRFRNGMCAASTDIPFTFM